MPHIEWGTALYQLIFFIILIGIPITIVIITLRRNQRRKGKIEELEKRIEQLEKANKQE